MTNIISPVDGKIQAIDIVKGKYKVYCDVGVFDGNNILAPIDSSMIIKSYTNGLNLSSDTYKAKLLNERVNIKFGDISLKLLGGVCNSKIKLLKEDTVQQGEKIGKFINGIAIMKLPKYTDLSIQIGDKIKAGQTMIGKYNG